MEKKKNFIEKAIAKHGDKYDYSKVEYVNSETPVCIICPEHGEFYQRPSSHLRGCECPECANYKRGKRMSPEEWINRAKEIHGEKYDYSKAEIINAMRPVVIICPEHGEFTMSMNNHVNQKQGCPKCADKKLSLEEIIENFRKVHGDKYDYTKCVRKKMNHKWTIICPKHGEFEQSATKHLKGQGCPVCAGTKKKNTNCFVKEASKVHDGKYDYSKSDYIDSKTFVTITCPRHGDFKQIPNNHLSGHGCPKCVERQSVPELEIGEFLKENGIEYITNSRDIIPPYEIDIFIPGRNIAIEHDGLRWHSERHCEDPNYHLMKSKLCEEKGVRLIHVFEDEWMFKRDIVESRLKNVLNINSERIYARKCVIKEVRQSETKAFLEENHIQGNCVSKYRYGLYNRGELVCVMTFGKTRKNVGGKQHDGEYELLRFCNKKNTHVVGGASRLLKHFIKEHHPSKIISYSDKRWGGGGMYSKLGFKLNHSSCPNYFYVVGYERHNRFRYRKDVLVSKYGCPPYMSEHDFCKSKGWYRIYDCGTDVWLMNLR